VVEILKEMMGNNEAITKGFVLDLSFYKHHDDPEMTWAAIIKN